MTTYEVTYLFGFIGHRNPTEKVGYRICHEILPNVLIARKFCIVDGPELDFLF
jgi:hypothetical protein